MGLAGYTALSDLKDLLVLTPNLVNLPVVELIYDEKVVGLADDQQENIFLKLDGEGIQYFLHGDNTWHTVQISVDVWTRVSLDRLNDIVKAIFSTLKTNVRFVAPNTNNQYADLLVIGNHPHSEQYRNIFRHTFDIQIRRTDP